MIAYSYIRFSSAEQRRGDSYRRQLEASEKYAQEHGLTLDTSLKLHDLGLSAFDKANVTKGRLGAFLRAIEDGRVPKGSYLLVESLDRLSRAQVMDALSQFTAILNAGVIIVTLSDKQVYSKESVSENPMQLIISILIMVRAHEESLTKSDRVGKAWQRKLTEGLNTHKLVTKAVPKWMRVVDGKIELIPERAEVVRRIFSMVKEGLSQDTIVRTLNAEMSGWNTSGEWHPSYIHKLTVNHATYGAFETGGKISEGYFPAVITKEEFDYVRSLRSKRRTRGNVGAPGIKRGHGVTNLFSGLTYCGYCGARMQIAANFSKKHNRNDRYLICYGARIGKTNCEIIRWNYRDIEGAFLMQIPQVDLGAMFGGKRSEKLEQLEAERVKLLGLLDGMEKKITNLYIAIEDEPLPGLVKRLKDMEATKEESEKSLALINAELTIERMSDDSGRSRIKLLLMLFKAMSQATDELQLRTIREGLFEQIRSFVERIDLYPSGPTLNRENRDMAFMRVRFKSGNELEII